MSLNRLLFRPLLSLPFFALLACSGGVQAAAATEEQICAELVRHVPGLKLAGCREAKLRLATERSVQGRSLLLRDIPPGSGTPLLKVLVMGAMHGDEAASSTVVFDWIARIEREKSDGGKANRIYWRMLPVVNPDGLLRRPATRVNARGVDLNRNFPTSDWAAKAHSYWQQRTGGDPRRFPGPAPLSEPETRWVHGQIETFKPDLIVSVHAPYGVLDFDGPPPPPSRLGELHLNQVGIYPGSLGNYGGVEKNVPVITVELKHAWKAPAKFEMARMWTDLSAWIDHRLVRYADAASKNDTFATQVQPCAADAPPPFRRCSDDDAGDQPMRQKDAAPEAEVILPSVPPQMMAVQ